MRMLWISFLPLLLYSACADDKDKHEVKTAAGVVRGFKMTTGNSKDVEAFLGIPFAAPPVGKNRFAPPKHLDPWQDVFNADSFSKDCYQFVDEKIARSTWWMSTEPQTENCLTLNIWVPTPRPKKSAVLVWIHGGGFFAGSSSIPLYDGSVLASEEDVIVVSINYRLSALGFLYLDHPDAPGNVALMDQAAGLKWVQKNIARFGGDPKRVTIFGESAGGVSVGFHLLAPTSLELFRNAILQSGTPNCYWAYLTAEEALENSLFLAKKLGCPVSGDRQATIKCLQAVASDDFLEAVKAVNDLLGGWINLTFRPVVDGTYIKSSPMDLLKEGKFCGEKNVIIGYTREDGSFLFPAAHPQVKMEDDFLLSKKQLKDSYKKIIFNSKAVSSLHTAITDFVYTDWDATSEDKYSARQQLVRYLTDHHFACPALTMTDKLAKKGNKVFAYRFDHIPASRPGTPIQLPLWMGSTHGDEIPFIFGHSLKEGSSKNPDELKLVKKLMHYWANFAKNDNPNDSPSGEWVEFTSTERKRLHIKLESNSVQEVDRKRECSFWENIFPEMLKINNT